MLDSFNGFNFLSSNIIDPKLSTTTSNEALSCGGMILSTTASKGVILEF